MLGFTNVDNAGVAGLELKYDDLLTGENGVVLTAVNAWGYTLEQSYETERFPTEGTVCGSPSTAVSSTTLKMRCPTLCRSTMWRHGLWGSSWM